MMALKGLFTWGGGPQSSGVGFFCFHALGDTKQKKPTPLDRGPPLHVNRVLVKNGFELATDWWRKWRVICFSQSLSLATQLQYYYNRPF